MRRLQGIKISAIPRSKNYYKTFIMGYRPLAFIVHSTCTLYAYASEMFGAKCTCKQPYRFITLKGIFIPANTRKNEIKFNPVGLHPIQKCWCSFYPVKKTNPLINEFCTFSSLTQFIF